MNNTNDNKLYFGISLLLAGAMLILFAITLTVSEKQAEEIKQLQDRVLHLDDRLTLRLNLQDNDLIRMNKRIEELEHRNDHIKLPAGDAIWPIYWYTNSHLNLNIK